MIHTRHSVEQEGRSYQVVIGERLLEGLPEVLMKEGAIEMGRCAVVVSPAILRLYASVIEPLRRQVKAVVTVEDGEEAKNLASVARLLDDFAMARLRREDLIIAIGGGVVGDLVGFAASIYLRGLAVVHVPTTLLAQVDSSVGGKTGVNLDAGKNLAGTFHYPRLVISDISLLETLDERQMISGAFEALKSGVIADSTLFELFESDGWRDALPQVVDRSVQVKTAIVSSDPREGDRRRLLNYGHTLGHALEAALEYAHITHGEAVGWGMIAANQIARDRGVLPSETADRINRAILSLRPRWARTSVDVLLQFVEADKKFTAGKKVMTLPTSIGECLVFDDITTAELERGARVMIESGERRG